MKTRELEPNTVPRLVPKEKPWRHYVETIFHIQCRTADYHFTRAERREGPRGVRGHWERSMTDYPFGRG